MKTLQESKQYIPLDYISQLIKSNNLVKTEVAVIQVLQNPKLTMSKHQETKVDGRVGDEAHLKARLKKEHQVVPVIFSHLLKKIQIQILKYSLMISILTRQRNCCHWMINLSMELLIPQYLQVMYHAPDVGLIYIVKIAKCQVSSRLNFSVLQNLKRNYESYGAKDAI